MIATNCGYHRTMKQFTVVANLSMKQLALVEKLSMIATNCGDHRTIKQLAVVEK